MNSTGFWLNRNSGKVISVREHGSSIIENPAKFGFSKQEIDEILNNNSYNSQAVGKKDSRTILLKKAFDKGWVRVRQVGPSWTFEFSGMVKTVVNKIVKKFGDEFGSYTSINLHDVGSNQSWSFPYKDMLDAYREGEFEDSVISAPSTETPQPTNAIPPAILSTANRDKSVRNILRKSIEPKFAMAGGTYESRILETIRRILFK